MPKENIIPIENKKPIEIVAELKNEIPTFEEFMENYEGPANYTDLNNGDIGIAKGYGPCIKNGTLNYDNCHCPPEELDRQHKIIRNIGELDKIKNTNRTFRLNIWLNSTIVFSSIGCMSRFVTNISEAAKTAEEIVNKSGDWGKVNCWESERKTLYDRIHKQISLYKQDFDVDTAVGNT